jgi:hypothetical protein
MANLEYRDLDLAVKLLRKSEAECVAMERTEETPSGRAHWAALAGVLMELRLLLASERFEEAVQRAMFLNPTIYFLIPDYTWALLCERSKGRLA